MSIVRNIFGFLISFVALHGFVLAQSSIERAPNSPGSYRKPVIQPASKLSRSENNKAAQMLNAAIEICKKVYPNPIGADIGPYGGVESNYRGPSEFPNGPYTLHLTIPFYDMFKTGAGGAEASGEYSSHIELWINRVQFMLQVNYVHDGNDLVFRAPFPGIAVNGFPKYNNMILVLPPRKSLPWRPATKQEYLENLIASLKSKLNSPTSGEKQRIADVEQILASLSASAKKEIAYVRKYKYINPKTRNFESDPGYSNWAGFLNASDTTADQLVIIDENFYDKTLPRNSWQVIVIERSSVYGGASTRASPQEVQINKQHYGRMNTIVQNPEFLPAVQKLLGENGLELASTQKVKTPRKFVAKKIDHRNIDRIVDSLFRNYRIDLPPAPVFSGRVIENPPPVDLPSKNQKKSSLAARRLETREELIQYIDDLDKKISAALGTTVTEYNDASTNNRASYGYWLMNKPGPSLLLAIKAAKQQPDNDCILNNLGSNLSVCGIDYMAVPLYIVCLKKEPDNSTINNNLGQSWLALGDLQKAEYYLKKAIASSPYHHHSNNSLGYLYMKQGNKNSAIQCFENSLRGSFTFKGLNGLNKLKPEAAIRLMNYIRHRYRQPDYLNFNKYIPPRQCLSSEETEARKAEHKAYQKTLDDQISKYNKLRQQQSPLAEKASKEIILRAQQGKSVIRPFQIFAEAVIISLTKEYEDKMLKLQKDLIELEKNRARLELEYDEVMKQTMKEFEPREEKVGEGNGDPTLDEEICEARISVIDHYLPLFAENNEERFNKMLHAEKGFLNDYLYWIRLASSGEEQYRLSYYDLILSMLKLLKEVRLTAIEEDCHRTDAVEATKEAIEIKEPDCPLPIGVEIPFVIGKIELDCESWGIEAGEGIVLNIGHKFGGETTIAFGAGETFYSTPKIGKEAFALNPGLDVNAKGQLFITFEGSTVVDGGFLWEAEIDLKALGKPAELKQNFTWAINKGFTAEGPLTSLIDKIYEIPPEKQVNKNVRIYKPKQK